VKNLSHAACFAEAGALMSGVHYIIEFSEARVLENSELVSQLILCHLFSSAFAFPFSSAIPGAEGISCLSFPMPQYYTIKQAASTYIRKQIFCRRAAADPPYLLLNYEKSRKKLPADLTFAGRLLKAVFLLKLLDTSATVSELLLSCKERMTR
jgi:hypothetical protein